jgi:uncharacterized protein (DUF2141 family)
MKSQLLSITISTILLFTCSYTFSQQKSLVIEINNVNTDEGEILVSLYESEISFKNFKPDKYVIINAKKGTLQCTINNLDKSVYAIGILHDLNENRLMDKNFIGLPQEGFGFSKDALGAFGPPSFAQAAINLDSLISTAKIKMKYF